MAKAKFRIVTYILYKNTKNGKQFLKSIEEEEIPSYTSTFNHAAKFKSKLNAKAKAERMGLKSKKLVNGKPAKKKIEEEV